MKISMFHLMQHRELPDDFEERYDSVWVDPPWWELCDPEQISRFYHWSLDEMLHAARLGFDGVCTNEHHQNAYGFQPSPNLMGGILGKLTREEEFEETAIIQMGSTLPSNPIPLRIAEEYAMLDLISEGRLVAGMPLGTSMDVNLCYGIEPLEQRERHKEAHDFILEAWNRDEIFAYNGKYFQLPKVNCWPRPIQSPHPPIWIPGQGSKSTQDFVMENDHCYCFLSYAGYQKAEGLVEQYWERVDEWGLSQNPFRLGYLQLVAVAESDAKAEELYADHVEYFYHKTQHVPGHYFVQPGHMYYDDMVHTLKNRAQAGLYDEEEQEEVDVTEMDYADIVEEGRVIAGGPDTVADRLTEVVQNLRAGNLMVLLPIGSMPHELTKKNIEIFAKEVKPQLDDLWEEEWENHWWPEPLRDEESVVVD